MMPSSLTRSSFACLNASLSSLAMRSEESCIWLICMIAATFLFSSATSAESLSRRPASSFFSLRVSRWSCLSARDSPASPCASLVRVATWVFMATASVESCSRALFSETVSSRIKASVLFIDSIPVCNMAMCAVCSAILPDEPSVCFCRRRACGFDLTDLRLLRRRRRMQRSDIPLQAGTLALEQRHLRLRVRRHRVQCGDVALQTLPLALDHHHLTGQCLVVPPRFGQFGIDFLQPAAENHRLLRFHLQRALRLFELLPSLAQINRQRNLRVAELCTASSSFRPVSLNVSFSPVNRWICCEKLASFVFPAFTAEIAIPSPHNNTTTSPQLNSGRPNE